MNKKIVSAVLLATMVLTGCNSVSKIDQAQLENGLAVNAMSAPAKNGVLAGKDIKENFNKMTNGTGSLDREFFRKQLVTLTADKEFLTLSLAAFDKSDSNKDGKISFEEFKILDVEFDKVIAPLQPKKNSLNAQAINPLAVNKLFDMIKDSQNSISEKAFIKYYADPKISSDANSFKDMFALIDTDKNHVLSLAEFKKVFDTQTSKNGFSDLSAKDKMKWILMAPVMWFFDKMGWLHIQ